MKRTIKKIICICVVMIIALSIKVNAATNLTVSQSKTKAKAGEEIVIKVNAECSTKLTAILLKLNYDESKLTLKDKKVAEGLTDYAVESGRYELLSMTAKESIADALTLTFEVKANASKGETQIKVENIEIIDVENGKHTVGNITKTVTIEDETEEPSPSPTPTPTTTPNPTTSNEPTNTPEPTASPTIKPSTTTEVKKITQDETASKEKIPYAGVKTEIIFAGILLTVAVATVSYILIRKTPKID